MFNEFIAGGLMVGLSLACLAILVSVVLDHWEKRASHRRARATRQPAVRNTGRPALRYA